MDKDTLYFPHDYNARGDEKMSFYLSKFGAQGYGIYWILIEELHQAKDGKLTVKLLDGVAYANRVDITLLYDCYNTLITAGLLVTDGEYYWSNRVQKNRQKLQESREKKSKAGKAGMQARYGNHNTVITESNSVITLPNKGKESKGKKRIKREKEIPPLEIFVAYAKEQKPNVNEEEVKFKYKAWVENDWHTGKGAPILNWKSTLSNTLAFIGESSNGTRKMVH